MIDIKHISALRNALANLDPRVHSNAEAEYARGILMGVVSALQAVTGCSYAEAFETATAYMPYKVMRASIPLAWMNDVTDKDIELTI